MINWQLIGNECQWNLVSGLVIVSLTGTPEHAEQVSALAVQGLPFDKFHASGIRVFDLMSMP